MTDRPIIFSGPMVRRLLDGSKTQTRRICKPQPYSVGDICSTHQHNTLMIRKHGDDQWKEIKCPYGKIGDQLWVREAFCYWSKGVIHKEGYNSDFYSSAGLKWRPSIHMPRWASRLTLEIKKIRVERLQDISENDAKAEGASYWPDPAQSTKGPIEPYRHGFWRIWQQINGQESWDENPWVWVIEFERVKP